MTDRKPRKPAPKGKMNSMDTELRSRYLQQCRDLIDEHGLMVQEVMAQPFAFFYTVGMTPVLGYELFLIGLPGELASSFLNTLAARLRETTIADGELIEDLSNLPLKLRTQQVVNTSTGEDLSEALTLAFSLGYAPTSFRQVLWPDPKGLFPDEPGYDYPCSQNVSDVIGPDRTQH